MTRVVCRQLAPTVGDLAGNQEVILRTVAEATSAGADILVPPELAASGYVFRSRAEAESCAVTAADPLLADWAAAVRGGSVVVCGFAERGGDGALYNSAAVVDATGVPAVYRKAHLWDRENLFFTPGTERPPVVLIAQAAARVNRVVIACCDRGGTERGQEWTEGTSVIDAQGWLAAVADADGEAWFDTDLTASRDKRISPHNHLFDDRRTDLYP